MVKAAASEPITVTVSPTYVGVELAEYIGSLPPALRGTEVARLAYAGYRAERASSRRRKSAVPVAGPVVVERIGRKIAWVE